jgi:ComF family protein
VFPHAGLPREIVLRLKYRGERHLAGCAARLILDYSPHLPSRDSTLVPVPASRQRLRERGYNQAGLLAKQLAGLTGSRFRELLRREDRPPQVGLGELERRENVSGAFSVAGGITDGCDVWLIDDVMTTGSTICEAAQVLADAGVRSVTALTLTYRDTLSGSII